MKALDRKLLRDLWNMKGQALAIAVVIVSGISTFIMLISTMHSLNLTKTRYYQEFRFADVFASLKRAPEGLKYRIAEIPGVDRVETRVAAYMKLDIKGFNEPVTARVVSVPDDGRPVLNGTFIRRGRGIEPGMADEVLVSEAFADAHGLNPGDSLGAVINGKWKRLRIAGIALSPEYVLQIRPGALSPDYKRYGIIWMGRTALGSAYDMDGAFNDVAITLSRGAVPEDVIVRLDSLLDRFGGLGAYPRKDQVSHRYLSEEFRQLQRSSEIYPLIFIAVSAYLLNVVVSRLIGTQREQIATLKAFGYRNIDIAVHYIKLVIVICLAGVGGGVAVGVWLGKGLGRLYMEFYRFPYLYYELLPSVVVTAAVISTGAAVLGTVFSVWRAAVYPPAQAMRPEPPASYRKSLLERLGLGLFLSQPTKMIVRNIERRPVKSALTILGIAFSCSIMIAGRFATDAVEYMLDVQFKVAQKEDLTVTFTEPTSIKVLYEMKRMTGVRHAEAFRSVPVRFRFRHRSYKTAIQGIDPENRLYSVLDSNLKPIPIPPSGIVLTDYLGEILGVRPGDSVTVEFLEGSRPVRQVPVVALASQYIGLSGYMDMAALNRLSHEGEAASGVYLTVDPVYLPEIFRDLVNAPRVAGTTVRADEVRNFYEIQARAFLFFTFVATILAGTIAFGVVYNTARIALSERSWELASLRVLGFTRREISYILLGELTILTILAIPLGFLIGNGICAYMAKAFETDLYRVPLVIGRRSYSLAATTVIVSALLSGLIVRHRLDHLDLVAVLKTKE